MYFGHFYAPVASMLTYRLRGELLITGNEEKTNSVKYVKLSNLEVRGSTLTFLHAHVLENYLSYIYNTKRILYLLGNIKE